MSAIIQQRRWYFRARSAAR